MKKFVTKGSKQQSSTLDVTQTTQAKNFITRNKVGCNSCNNYQCNCSCRCTTNNFSFFTSGTTTELDTSAIFSVPTIATIVASGWTVGQNPSQLSSVGTLTDNGLGLWSDLVTPGNHYIDNQHFVQLDVLDLVKFVGTSCASPTITIGGLQTNFGFQIGGSNDGNGDFGTILFSFTQTGSGTTVTVPLFNPASALTFTLYKYISITAYSDTIDPSTVDCVITNIGVSNCQF